MTFLFQAFSITSSASEALDNLFTDSLKKHMPPNGLQVFGINQLEEEIKSEPVSFDSFALKMDDFPMYNMCYDWYGTWYSFFKLYDINEYQSLTVKLNDYILKPALFGHSDQWDVELPTLLHFSAKYGFKKLTSTLLQCPGALQAYSIANKDGDYPNTLAERSGFPDLRQFMDDYVVSCKFTYL